MKYFISDLHFDHKNILKYNAEFRSQWNTIEEMNEGLIKLWNETVSPQDEVYFLGDLTFKMKAQNYINILSRLNGKVHWIFGNHDNRSEKLLNELKQHTKLVKFKGGKVGRLPLLESASMYKEIKIGEEKVVLFHYPIKDWNGKDHGSIHLHGHTHQLDSGVEGRIINVCYDKNGRFLSEQDVIEMTKDKLEFHGRQRNKS